MEDEQESGRKEGRKTGVTRTKLQRSKIECARQGRPWTPTNLEANKKTGSWRPPPAASERAPSVRPSSVQQLLILDKTGEADARIPEAGERVTLTLTSFEPV